MDEQLKVKIGRELKDYVAITLGIICYAFGWVAFMLPYQISTGGLTGISALIYYVTGIEIQVSYFIINAIFMVFALKILGPKFCLKTLFAIPVLTFFLWLFQVILKDDAGDYWIYYHAYSSLDRYATRHLFMDKIEWDEDGFPYVEGKKEVNVEITLG